MKMKSVGRLIALFILTTIIASIFELHAEEELRPYKLINADKLIINKIESEYITNLFGNVHFFYGDTEFFCDKADIFELQKIVRMQGNVKVYEDTLSLKADNVDYFRKSERLFLHGDVLATETHIDSTIRTFKAEEIEYFRNSRELFAKENVITYDERENMHGTCGELKYFMNDGYGYLMKEPVLSIAKKDTISISAEKIEYFKDYKKVVATFNVKTFSKEFIMSSDFLLYFADEEKAVYLGEPKFTSDLADATAIEFRIFFEEQKIKKAILQDSCYVQFSEVEDQPKKSWAVGDLMEFNFEKGNITFCEATGNVKSHFQQESTESRDFSANNAQGEHLIIEMDDQNKIERISMKDKVHGIYKFKHKNW
ncbi:MAG: LPS export ABC transporter periplasmic protein LptC [Candidatus Cloacimonetes bacterium]|nr:LPS export ABC transporter periplasmic protein LptC [Candidatus Cloacimonadota bacterium]